MRSNVASSRSPKRLVSGRAGLILTLAVASVSYSLVQSMVNPGLEALRTFVHTDQLGVSWVLTAFLLSSAILTPLLGRLGDQIGKRLVLITVLLLLVLGSVVSALAQNLPVLLAGRVLQGAGGATLPLAFGIVRDLVPRYRVGPVVGMIAAVSSVGGAAGVLVTGPIINGLGVPWLFWIPALANGLVALAVFIVIPSARSNAPTRMNWPAGAVLAVALVLFLLPISLGGQWGWASALTIGLFALACLACALWVVVEIRSKVPLIDMRVFRLRPVWTANLASLLFGFTLYSAFGFIPGFLQIPTSTGYGLGESISASGLLFLPMLITQLIAGLLTGPLSARTSAKSVLLLGSLPVTASFILLAVLHSARWQVALATAVGGIGFGIGLSALSALVVHAVPAEHTGAATGMNANIRTIGGAVGAAVVAGILSAGSGPSRFPSERSYATVFLLLAGISVAGFAASLLIPRPTAEAVREESPEERAAELIDQHSPF
jgi:MFS family permease